MTIANDLGLYDREADSWWRPGSPLNVLRSMNPHRFRFFDRFQPDWRGVKVLDVGCGGGFTCEFLAARGAVVSGIDQSAATLDAAIRHAKESGLAIDYKLGVGERLPYPDASFDAVTCVDVLEHVADLEKTLSEIQRVLKPGGRFYFDTINKTLKSRFVMIWLLERITKQIPRGTHDWNMFIPPRTLLQALAGTGFEKPELAGFDIKGIENSAVKAEINDNLSVMYIGTAVKK